MVENLDEVNQFEDAEEECLQVPKKPTAADLITVNAKFNQSYGSDEDDDDFYDDGDDIPSDIGENEPGMVPSRGPNCQVNTPNLKFYSFNFL